MVDFYSHACNVKIVFNLPYDLNVNEIEVEW